MIDPENLQSAAVGLIQVADSSLESPDEIQIFQDYHVHTGGEFILALSAQTEALPGTGDKRYLYLHGSHEETGCGPSFSLDMNRLVHEGTVTGLLTGADSIIEAAQSADETLVSEVLLLDKLLALMMQYNRNDTVNRAVAEDLNEAFIALLETGSTVAHPGLRSTAEDGTVLAASGVRIEGSYQHVAPFLLSKPKVKILVKKPKETSQVVLEQTRNDALESYEELSNPLERLARVAQPEDVHRDEDGRTEMVFGSGLDLDVIESAERAMGLRQLEVGRVSLIDTYVQELLID